MRVRADIEPPPGQELTWPHLIKEDEGADHLPFLRGQGAADLEAANVVRAGQARSSAGCQLIVVPPKRAARAARVIAVAKVSGAAACWTV